MCEGDCKQGNHFYISRQKRQGEISVAFLNVKNFVDFAHKWFLIYGKLWLLQKFKNDVKIIIDLKSITKYKGGAITFG